MNIFESNNALQGERATESTHRKIELQSPADLTYLIANLTKAAREKLDKYFPADATPEGEDAMRRRVEELVDEYIRNTFDLAKDSISINGMNARDMEAELEKAQEGEELEPYDHKLVQRIIALNKQIEHETLKLATLRRTAPQETAQIFVQSFEKLAAADEARRAADQDTRLAAAQAATVDVGPVHRVEEMQSTWERGRADLEALTSGWGGTMAKMEKAGKAAEVLEQR